MPVVIFAFHPCATCTYIFPIPRLRIEIDFLAEERSEMRLAYADGRDEQFTAVIRPQRRPRRKEGEGAGRAERSLSRRGGGEGEGKDRRVRRLTSVVLAPQPPVMCWSDGSRQRILIHTHISS